jgi:hypothetical protein
MSRVEGRNRQEVRNSLGLTPVALSVLLFVGPLAFHRGTFTVFLQVQRTVLLLGGLLVLVCVASEGSAMVSLRRAGPGLMWATGAFVAALLCTTVTAGDRWAAWTGLEARGMGALSYLVLVGLFMACWSLGEERSVRTVLRAVAVAHVVVVAHVLVQVAGWDPMEWDSGLSIGGRVFSTLGNPNFGAAFVGFTFPVLFWHAYRMSPGRALEPLTLITVVFSAAAVGAMGSTQGHVLVLASAGIPLVEAARYIGRGRMEAFILAGPVVATMVLMPSRSPSKASLLAALGIVTATVVIRSRRRPGWSVGGPVGEGASTRSIASRFVGVGVGSTLLGAVILVVFGGRLVDAFTANFVQRTEFWSVGWDMFLRKPVLGHGLESFGDWFTRLRSAGHAVDHEALLTDSVHSVPLGILTGGGILVGLPYLAMLVLTATAAARSWRDRTDWESRLLTGVLTLMWVGYVLQSLVSVDVPSLALYGWVSAGLLVARGCRSVGPGAVGSSRRALQVGAVLLVGVLVAAGPLLGPLRADFAAHRGQVAYSEADFDSALLEVERAASLQPRNGFYTETLGRIHLQRGDADRALLAFEHSAINRPGNPGIARLTGRVAQQNGYNEMASFWFGDAVGDDPHAPETLAEAARFFAWSENPEAAYQLLEDYHRTNSVNPDARMFSREAFLLLGDVPNGRRGE